MDIQVSQLTIVTDVGEDLIVAQLAERELAPVAVREQVLKRVERLAEQAVCLPKVSVLVAIGLAAMVNGGLEGATDEST